MVTKHIRAVLPGLALAALLIGLNGCGWRQAPAQGSALDHLHIAIYIPGPNAVKPVAVLTFADASRVQHLYTTMLALPLLPPNMPCTAEAGPSYTLTFLQAGRTSTTASVQRFGCGRVSIPGEVQARRTNHDFWSQLDQAIYQATPIARPQRLAILQTSRLDRSPQTAQITSVETVQRLYQAILALSHAPQNGNCSPEPLHHYQLVFHTTDQAIASVIDNTCHTISLDGNYKSRSGTFAMNDRFKQLFAQVLATATFAPARPDRLTLDLSPVRGADRQGVIADASLRQQLYMKIVALPPGKTPPNCPSGADKLAGKGMWYLLNFTQWDLPVLVDVEAYEGSCTLISVSNTQGMGMGQALQGDRAFWNLIHHAANR